MSDIRHVCVVGAGIVGCATAYALSLAGLEVTLMDEMRGVGRVTSYANGAQLSYSYVEPLATPQLLAKLPAMLFERDSPLRLRLRVDPHQWAWAVRFLRACTQTAVTRSTASLLSLSFLSRDTLSRWIAADDLQFDHAVTGKLVLYGDHAGLDAASKQVARQRCSGADQTVLSPAQCSQVEPALGIRSDAFAGGVWTPDEAVGDAFRLCEAMASKIQERGGTLLLGARVTGFRRGQGSRITSATTSDGEVEADAFVLCAGNGARALGLGLGLELPIYPIKGYSVSLPIRSPGCAPRVSVTDGVRKMVFAPLGGRLRVAGMAELTGDGTRIDAARIDALVDRTDELFPGAIDLGACDTTISPWAGERPATPTSRPIIGPTKYANVWINAGHGPLGFTLAAGSAVCVCALLTREIAPVPMQDFAMA